jgi:hypothetical protein
MVLLHVTENQPPMGLADMLDYLEMKIGGEYYDCVLCDRCVMSDAQIENSGGII